MVSHGYLKFIPNGQTILFAMGLFGFFYLYRQNKLDSELRSILKFTHRLEEGEETLPLKRMPKFLQEVYKYFREHTSGKHDLCHHKYSCLSTAVEVHVKINNNKNSKLGYDQKFCNWFDRKCLSGIG